MEFTIAADHLPDKDLSPRTEIVLESGCNIRRVVLLPAMESPRLRIHTFFFSGSDKAKSAVEPWVQRAEMVFHSE
jgi:hypothetical protein